MTKQLLLLKINLITKCFSLLFYCQIVQIELKMIIEFSLIILHFFGLFLPLLLLVAFITLLERKEIAIMQRRRGPNIIGVFGLLQPIADGFKLLIKEPVFPYIADKILFLFSPIITFSCSLISWGLIPISGLSSYMNIEFGVLVVFSLSSLSVYGIILAGWSSNSKYGFLGALRSTSQLIAYEVSFMISILPIVVLTKSLNFETIIIFQNKCWFFWPFFVSAICVFIFILAETNRLPFDLPEAESELVSGYNVEYSAMFFAFFYLAEYLNILLMSTIFNIFFFGGWVSYSFCNNYNFIFFSLKTILIVYIIIWIRVTFPRYRFDQLIELGWKCLLPLILGFYIYVVGVYLFEYYILILLCCD